MNVPSFNCRSQLRKVVYRTWAEQDHGLLGVSEISMENWGTVRMEVLRHESVKVHIIY